MTNGARPKWKQGPAVRDVLRDANLALEATPPEPASSQDEPFGYFRAEPFGWTDCAATDEGAIALYERPAAPAVPQGEPVAWLYEIANCLHPEGNYTDWRPCISRNRPSVPDGAIRNIQPLYTAAPSQEPVALTDSYAGVIAWIGDKQCKLLVTEDAIKHEHTPGVVMRNTAHQCVQEVIIAALREKQGGV